MNEAINIEITVDILRETDAAILVSDGDREVWLPKSQIEYSGDPGDESVCVEIPEWLAEEKGLI